MHELKKSIEERERVFEEMTAQILQTLTSFTEGTERFLADKCGDDMRVVFQWKDVNIDEDGDLVMIYGNMINEETSNGIIVSAAVPIKLAKTGTPEQIREYMVEMDLERSLEEMAEVDKNFETMKVTKTDNDDGFSFNLDQLTEEQRKQLQMFQAFGDNDDKDT